MQEFLGSVLSGFEVEELLVLVDELGVHGGVEELVVGQNILEERDVGLEMERQVERRKLFNEHFTPLVQNQRKCKHTHTHSIEEQPTQDSNRAAEYEV